MIVPSTDKSVVKNIVDVTYSQTMKLESFATLNKNVIVNALSCYGYKDY